MSNTLTVDIGSKDDTIWQTRLAVMVLASSEFVFNTDIPDDLHGLPTASRYHLQSKLLVRSSLIVHGAAE